MFFDFPEIVIIFGVALVVLGPKKLPSTAAQIGRWVGRARAMARQFREQLEQEVGSVESALDTSNPPREPTIRPPSASPPQPAAPPPHMAASGLVPGEENFEAGLAATGDWLAASETPGTSATPATSATAAAPASSAAAASSAASAAPASPAPPPAAHETPAASVPREPDRR